MKGNAQILNLGKSGERYTVLLAIDRDLWSALSRVRDGVNVTIVQSVPGNGFRHEIVTFAGAEIVVGDAVLIDFDDKGNHVVEIMQRIRHIPAKRETDYLCFDHFDGQYFVHTITDEEAVSVLRRVSIEE